MSKLQNFTGRVKDRSCVVGIVGLGYVGLPLALGYSEQGFKVVGFDVDQRKVDAIEGGTSYIEHIPANSIRAARSEGKLKPTTDFSRIREVDAIVICVPTPLDRHREPDLTYVESTISSVLPYLKEGQLISLESTTYPGTTEESIASKVREAGFEIGKEAFVVYSPEREDPGNANYTGANIPKVVGGMTDDCLEAGVALYGAMFEEVVPVSSPRVAEFSKLLENIYRAVNIGLVNEMKIVADRMGVDIWEVISAAASKPFGFTPFYPGPGLGGHCIPIDPFYLTWKAREYGIHTRFIELAGEVNAGMPEYVVAKIGDVLNEVAKPVRGSRILVMGLAYKPNVDDMRESPSFEIMSALREKGAEVSYYDPHIPRITRTREHAEWTGTESVGWSHATISSFDCVVIATNHADYNLEELADWAPLIVDTRNAMSAVPSVGGKIFKA